MITANQSPLASARGGIRILLPLVLVLAASIDAFSFTMPKLNPANPALQDMSQAQDGILINIRLDVGQKEDSHLLIDGLVVELHDDAIDTKKAKNSVPLPGSSGPNPNLSSGAKSLQILDAARFIGHDGINHVDMQDGCWEMVSQPMLLQDIFYFASLSIVADLLMSLECIVVLVSLECLIYSDTIALFCSCMLGMARRGARRRHCLRLQSRRGRPAWRCFPSQGPYLPLSSRLDSRRAYRQASLQGREDRRGRTAQD